MTRKCPYISPSLNCMSTGKGTVLCLDPGFHERCQHRHFADRRMGFVPVADVGKRKQQNS